MSSESSAGTGRRRPFGKPHPVDVHVGSRVRDRRTARGLSQEKLGDALGLTFQQVQKYERGANRIGASRLYELSRVLDVPVGFFFEGYEPPTAGAASGMSEPPAPGFENGPATREQMEFMRVYNSIVDARARRSLYDLAKSIAKAYFRA